MASVDPATLPMISIHAPRTGSDTLSKHFPARYAHFNPRSPHGERRAAGTGTMQDYQFQSTLPARGATRVSRRAPTSSAIFQSTLPARGATEYREEKQCERHFNPRSPHGERLRRGEVCRNGADFNPRSPHGERPASSAGFSSPAAISIHAPRTGSDTYGVYGHIVTSISIHAPRTGSDSAK